MPSLDQQQLICCYGLVNLSLAQDKMSCVKKKCLCHDMSNLWGQLNPSAEAVRGHGGGSGSELATADYV